MEHYTRNQANLAAGQRNPGINPLLRMRHLLSKDI
jgi:hypothetical protein